MTKAFIFKEWLKTRWFLALALLVCCGCSVYCMMIVHRALALRGVGHIWEIMISRDAVFVDMLEYLPMIVGLLLAVVQMVPEVRRKCLKLTLHLPLPRRRAALLMVCYGCAVLVVIFALDFVIVYFGMRGRFAPELVHRVLGAMLPWHLAGICAYLLAAWICLEPVWKMRIAGIVIAALVLSVFFIGSTPDAYSRVIVWLSVYTLCLMSLTVLAVDRFVAGKQD